MNRRVKEIVARSLAGKTMEAAEIKQLFSFPAISEESYYIQYAARILNQELNDGLAEVHGQVGIISGPCPCNCQFCSFAASNRIFHQQRQESWENIRKQCLDLETAGANAIYLMGTAALPFQGFLEIASRVRRQLRPETVMIANIADFGYQEALALKAAGLTGVYHALRLGEGQVTRISPARRRESMQSARQAGLKLGTCVEPVGPEHSVDELVEKTLLTREMGAVFSGAARRIDIPGSPLAVHGMSSKAQMALTVAVVALATGQGVAGNCTHEPDITGVMAGASLLWAESGSNPRDTCEATENHRGFSVSRCMEIFREAEVEVWSGPSRLFNGR